MDNPCRYAGCMVVFALKLISNYTNVIRRQLFYILLEFTRLVSQLTKNKYKTLPMIFAEIKPLFKSVDQNISLFVLLYLIYNTTSMYFTVTILQRPDIYGAALQRSTVYIICANSVISFLTMIILASDIHQASLPISDNGYAVLRDDQNPANSQFLFLRIID